MRKDHYSILGLTPAADEAAIRAAYRSLMRIHHPDADPNEEAVDKARQINEAYRVLGDADRRADYDRELAASRPLKFDPKTQRLSDERTGSRIAPLAAVAVVVAAVGMIAFAVSPARDFFGSKESSYPQPVTTAAAERSTLPLEQAPDSCANPSADHLVKREIFRLATLRETANLDKIREAADGAKARLEFRGAERSSSICNAWFALDLPAGLVVDGGRTNLNADISYRLVAAGEGVRIENLTGASEVVRSLATLGPEPKEPEAEPTDTRELAGIGAKQSRPRNPKPAQKSAKPVEAVQAKPECSGAKTRTDKLVCENDNLSTLDRQLGLLYGQSWNQADEKKKAALVGSRQRFIDRREACGSSSCMTNAYVSRLQEISDIMAGKVQR